MSKIGKIVKVQHAQGFKGGNAFLRRTKPTYLPVSLEYADGDVMVKGSLDVWTVGLSKDSKATFETVDL